MTRTAQLIVAPYDSGLRGVRMGLGPHALLRAGLEAQLGREGIDCWLSEVEPEEDFGAEIATSFALHREIRAAVAASHAEGRLPITLSGNCNTGVVGSLAAGDTDDLGLFWFDAHSDAETPESSTSGFLDGMALAMALGCCWAPMLRSVGAHRLQGSRAALVGAREISPQAEALLTRKGVSVVSPEQATALPPEQALASAFETMRSAGVRRAHVHVDLDVLDPLLVGPANDYALEGGLSSAQLNGLLDAVLRTFDLASASVASYDPRLDGEGKVARAGLEAISRLARLNP
jgi:arginase